MTISRRRALRLAQIPEFVAFFQAVLEREIGAARAVFDGTKTTLRDWIEAFYPIFAERLARDAEPIVRAFGEQIAAIALAEIGSSVRFDAAALSEQYSNALADRWTSDSIGQLRAMVRDESGADLEEQFEDRMGQWQETRPQRVAAREATQAGSAFTKIPFMVAGVERLIWAATGESCPLCQKLNGRVVSITEPFVKAGDTVDPEDGETTPLTTEQMIGHPPLHGMGGRGGVCDCMVIAG